MKISRACGDYLTCLIASFTFAATFSGNGAYASAEVIFWPSVTIQFRKSAKILPLAASLDWAGIIGAEAAAAVTPSNDAFRKTPAEFRTLPYGMLFCIA